MCSSFYLFNLGTACTLVDSFYVSFGVPLYVHRGPGTHHLQNVAVCFTGT